jgi:RND family efflux transporter MFP subunit
VATPGKVLLAVVKSDDIWIEAQIDAVDIGNVAVGNRVEISSDAYPEKIFEGKIIRINREAELKKTAGMVTPGEEDIVFRARIEVVNPEGLLKPGMPVDLFIVTQEKKDVLLIPREALMFKNDKPSVFVVKSNRVYPTEINIGLRDAANVEIKAGLKEGERVAISNQEKLKPKGRVKIE